MHTATLTSQIKSTEIVLEQKMDHQHAQLMERSLNRDEDDSRREIMILEHINFDALDVRYEQVGEAHAKTFNWIFEGSDSTSSNGFSDWLEGKGKDESLFWINGKAGSGKSTLMKYIYDDPRTEEKLLKWAAGQKLAIAPFFFWISGTADQCSQTGLLRSVLHYLLSQHRHLIREVFPDLWQALSITDIPVTLRAWTVSYASKAVKTLLGCDLGKVCIFIDGLDEYRGHDNHPNPSEAERTGQYREIVSLIKNFSSPHVKICFSSRPLSVFHNSFDQRPKLKLQELTFKDISRYARDSLIGNPTVAELRSESDWDLEHLVSCIVEQAQGVFLWVKLVVNSLLDGIENFDDVKEMESRLTFLPSDLTDLYRRMLKQIEPQYREEGYMTFAMADLALVMSHEQAVHSDTNFSDGHCEELCMLGLWFGLEYVRLERVGHPQRLTKEILLTESLTNEAEFIKAIKEIERKLKTRCAGLLEAGNVTSLDESDEDYQRRNVLMESRLGNRRVQYIHRTAKEFWDLEETRSFFSKRPITGGHDPALALLWSAIQKIRVYEPEKHKPPAASESASNDLFCLADSALLLARKRPITGGHDPALALLWSAIQRVRVYEPEKHKPPAASESASNDLFCLADSALLLARNLQDGSKACPVELLHLLDSSMQHQYSQYSQHGEVDLSWVSEAISTLYFDYSRYGSPYISSKKSNGKEDEKDYVRLNPPFDGDFLSLCILYSLYDYVEATTKYNPDLVKQKSGRPYLDYALASHDFTSVDVDPDLVDILLEAGAEPDEYCLTIYSMAEWERKSTSIYRDFGYDTWTPWQSALESVLWAVVGEYGFSTFNAKRHKWIEVFKKLLAKGPDVSVNTWVILQHGLCASYTVSQTIAIVFGEEDPHETAKLLKIVEELALTQGCAVYKHEGGIEPADKMRIRKALVSHLEMTEVQSDYWNSREGESDCSSESYYSTDSDGYSSESD